MSAFLCGAHSWRGMGPPWLQGLERFRSVGCWHLVVALPIDRTTLRYWPVCWKAHVSLYFEWSTGLCCMYSTSVNKKHHWPSTLWLYWCFYMLVSLWYLLFHSLRSSRYYVSMSGFWYLFFSELGDTFTSAQLFSSCLFVIHIPWLTVKLILYITSFDYSHLLCEIYLFSRITCFLISFIYSFFADTFPIQSL